ncbi:flagellar hook-associated protein FlgK [Devosia naphthalenivorans]|uniref:flagellar hook-associated protein FlgK n=1 Tax=Devosia naphthalenivorans TaxID=2082392 RepID=UPI000D37F653|nr:flagellar hook-associated protein FlgK [Devosia naphthalenivorans]
MGLTTSLNNAVSGLRINQDSIDVLSRNVANAGTPGYNRQSLNVIDYNAQSGTYARSAGVTRAFNSSLQTYYTRQVADTANSGVQANYLNRLQGFLGKPGSAASLDTLYGNLQNAMQKLATSPDDYTVRAQAVSAAQGMAETLNRLSTTVQEMRRETEGQIASSVNNVNGMLTSLSEVNSRLMDLGMTDSARSSLLDQRDRLVSSVAEIIDVKADYRPNGTVALMTRSGVGILDNGVSKFKFDGAGSLDATAEFNVDSSKSNVGRLTLTTPSGLTVDLVQQGVLQGGELAGLVTLRDKTLVEAQAQLDEIAAGLAQAFSTQQTIGEESETVPGTFSVPVTAMSPGNSLTIKFKGDGTEQTIKIVNTTETGVDYQDASGTRVVGVNMSKLPGDTTEALAGVRSALGSADPALPIDIVGDKWELLAAAPAVVTELSTQVTANGTDGSAAFNLFVDSGNSVFSNNLTGTPPQKVGFAQRIAINSDILADNRLMVKSDPSVSLGNADRPNYILDQMKSLQFVSGGDPKASSGRFQLNGNLGEVIAQVINFQGSTIGAAITRSDDRQLTLDTIVDQMSSEYGVDVNDEMARLMELQNAYAANARIVSVVKELIDQLFAST